jgi:hypothetical protein
MTWFFFVSTQLTKLFYERVFGRDLKVVVAAQHYSSQNEEADDDDAPLSQRGKQHM